EPFQRGTERVRTDHAGVGLGLAIVKSIAQAHDGTLTITPRTGGGLHVTVQLPATPAHAGGLNRPGFDAASGKPRTTSSERSRRLAGSPGA
ncbi:MAG TPA: ATP-binding protein, partial [Streptosporangiaceae bacterium]|nr:ATP-binding protein [Streptosporangiaceae bacterium]